MITNPNVLTMAVPAYDIDKIIGVFEGTLVSPDPGVNGSNYTEYTFPTTFNDTCLTRCVFSVDGGLTRNDDNMPVSYTDGGPVVYPLSASSFSRNNVVGIGVANSYVVSTSGHSQAYTVQFKIYCYAKTNQGIITPLPIPSEISYRTPNNFEKIYQQGFPSVTTSTTIKITETFLYSLNYVPDTKASIEYTSGARNGSIWPLSSALLGDLTLQPGQVTALATITPTSLTYTFD